MSDHLWNDKTHLREFQFILIFEKRVYIKVDKTYPNISYRKLAAFIKTESR
jgi:hypothetical protein